LLIKESIEDMKGVIAIVPYYNDGKKYLCYGIIVSTYILKIKMKDDLKKGHVLKASDLVAKRPGTGISPKKIKNILGKRIKRNLLKDTIITYKDIS